MPQPKGYEPFSRMYRIEATWRGISTDFNQYAWVYYEWWLDEETFNNRLEVYAQHPDYHVEAYEVDWYNDKELIQSWLMLQSGPFKTSNANFR